MSGIEQELVQELVRQTGEHNAEAQRATDFYRLALDFDYFVSAIATGSMENWNQDTRKEYARLCTMADYLLRNEPSIPFELPPTNPGRKTL